MFDYKQTKKDVENSVKHAGAWFEYDATKWTAIPAGMGLTYHCEMPHCVSKRKEPGVFVHVETPMDGHRFPAAICAPCAEYMGLTKPFAWVPIIDGKYLNNAHCEHGAFSLIGEGARFYGTQPEAPHCQTNRMPGTQSHPAQWQRDTGKLDVLFNEPMIKGPRVLCDLHRPLYTAELSTIPTMWPSEVSEAAAKFDKLMAALK
jgi:hypothetical protein